MTLSRVLLYILLAFFMYKFVFDFLVPILKVSFKIRKQVKDFQRQSQGKDPFQQNNATTTTSSSDQSSTKNNGGSATQPKAGDYIDFEEIK